MADKKISELTSASLPLAGTEVLPIVQSGSTVKVASNDLTVKNVRSNATTGLLQIAGPTAGTTRVMTTPDANFTAARTDAGQTFTGAQRFSFTSTRYVDISATAIGSQRWDDNGLVTFQQYINAGLSGVNQGIRHTFSLGANSVVRNAGYIAVKAASDYSSDANADSDFYIATAVDNNNSEQLKISSVGNVTALNGNFVIGTAGKGIDFSANTNAPGMTSELLTWYEEGTWTPSVGGDATYTARSGKYTRIGNVVTATFDMTINVLGTGSTNTISGLPFTVGTAGAASTIYYSNLALTSIYISAIGSGTTIILTGQSTAQVTMGYAVAVLGDGARLQMTTVYYV